MIECNGIWNREYWQCLVAFYKALFTSNKARLADILTGSFKNIYIAAVLKKAIMENDLRERRVKSHSLMRSLLDYTMGILYLAAAAFFIFCRKVRL